jgi:hypothetical protein
MSNSQCPIDGGYQVIMQRAGSKKSLRIMPPTEDQIVHPYLSLYAFPGAVKSHLQKRCTRLAAASDKVYQLLAHDRWFSPGTPASSTTKSGRYDIAEILLEVALSTTSQIRSKVIASVCPSNSHFYPVCTFSIGHCVVCSSSICCF